MPEKVKLCFMSCLFVFTRLWHVRSWAWVPNDAKIKDQKSIGAWVG